LKRGEKGSGKFLRRLFKCPVTEKKQGGDAVKIRSGHVTPSLYYHKKKRQNHCPEPSGNSAIPRK